MITGPTPIVLFSEKREELLVSFLGSEGTGAAIEFGAQQVIIVRDEQSKAKLPDELKDNLVLVRINLRSIVFANQSYQQTVLEVKGLEFEDVLLYNFFTDSPVTDGWKVINKYAEDKRKAANDSNGTKEDLSQAVRL